MPTVTIQKEQSGFTATAKEQCGQGQTVGEAIDSLLQQGITLPMYLRQLGGDEFFTQEQQDRKQELRQRLATLSTDQRAEYEALLDAELEATTARLKFAFR